MDIKIVVLERAVKWLVGGELMEFVKAAVAMMDNKDMTGEEKRERVIFEAKAFIANSTTTFISIAIEVAVLILKSSIASEKKEDA